METKDGNSILFEALRLKKKVKKKKKKKKKNLRERVLDDGVHI